MLCTAGRRVVLREGPRRRRALTQHVKADGVADAVGHVVADAAQRHEQHEAPEGDGGVQVVGVLRLALHVELLARLAAARLGVPLHARDGRADLRDEARPGVQRLRLAGRPRALVRRRVVVQ